MRTSFSFSRVWFTLSLVVLAFLYGTGVGKWGWFPHSFLDRAMNQARTVLPQTILPIDKPKPHFLHPRTYSREGVQTLKIDRMETGLTLISSSWKEYGGGLRLINSRGEVLHQWRVNPAEISSQSSDIASYALENFAGPHGTHLFPNGDVIVNVKRRAGLARLNACGDLIWSLPSSTGDWWAHHSVDRAENGSFWVGGARMTKPDWKGLQRFEEVREELIVKVSPNGKVLRKISVLDLVWRNGLQRGVLKQFENTLDNEDITHLNDIEELSSSMASQYPLFEKGDLVVSLRRPDLVFVFDPSSMEVKWKASDPFINQHDPDFIGDGWIGVFDNRQDFTSRGKLLGGSRILAVQPHTDSTKVLFPTPSSDTFYTPWGGKWQKLDNGNLLITEARAGRVLEVAPNGRTVWEWVHASWRRESSKDPQVPEVYEGTRYDLTREKIASWPCSSVDSASTSNQPTSVQ
ncbi:arylsulfotransferase family protein [Salinibacter ruber]|uniref:arylsulfotransferase family protein n=1 Tax=Salinibacter ruber TaxID=146919 RepID=UPI000E592A26|nr:arylsulfotransferase family protein [Salinibacter ruber]